MAPLPLASRVQSALAAQADPAPKRTARPRPRIWPIAVAACLCLFSVSLMAMQVWKTFAPRTDLAVKSLDIPTDLAENLVARHDIAASQPDHHYLPGVPQDDLNAIRKTLARSLDQGVLVTNLPDGWTFRGAALCPVGQDHAAQLIFTRGNQTVSLFSLPNADYPTSSNDTPYESMTSGHPIAGFTHGNGMYCLVGSSPDGKLTLEELKSLRDKIEDSAIFALGPTQKPSATMAVASR